jgi:Flp pilus assembly protein TadG
MSRRRGSPAGIGRPGTARHDDGAVTVEAALALLGLVVVLAAVVWCLGLLVAQLAVGEAARAGARAAARGDSTPVVDAEVHRLVPAAEVGTSRDGDHVTVQVRRSVRPPGLLSVWGAVTVSASAVAAAEPSAEPAP